MKKTFYSSLLVLSSILFVFSCAKEPLETSSNNPEDSTQNPVFETRTVTLKIEDNDPDSRVEIANNGKVGWKVGDEILIHGEYINKTGYSVVVTLDGVTNTISADKKSATITITLGDGSAEGTVKPYVHTSGETRDYLSTLYAMYPASAATTEQHHSYYNSQFVETNEPLMIGYYNSDDGDNSFVFKNLCSVLSFVMPDTKSFDYYIFSGNNSEKVGYTQYAAVYAQYSNGSEKFRQGSNYDSSKTNAGLTSISGPVVCDGTTLNNIYIPGLAGAPSSGISFSNGFTIEFVKDGEVTHKVSTSSSVSLAVNDYMPLGDISGYLKSYSRPAHVSALSSDKDLSVILGGKANCYFVAADVAANAGATFKFPHKQGNSSDAVGPVSSVELVWETRNSDTAPSVNSIISQVDFDETYIYFKMPDPIVSGNALIAAKNVIGEILWSWHIWVPETSITDKSGIYSTDMMDRNLGALVATSTGSARTVSSYGLLYQWGRKDPFVGAKSTSSGTFASVAGTAQSTAASKITLAESIKKPTLMGKGGGGQDWVDPSSNDLWKDDSKTKYDPCPPTYRIPKKDDTQVFHKVLSGQTGWENNTTYMYFTVGSPTSVFPYTGYIDDWGSMTSVNYNSSSQRADIWTSSWHYDNVGYGVDVRSDGTKNTINDFGKARGCSVRCVKE